MKFKSISFTYLGIHSHSSIGYQMEKYRRAREANSEASVATQAFNHNNRGFFLFVVNSIEQGQGKRMGSFSTPSFVMDQKDPWKKQMGFITANMVRDKPEELYCRGFNVFTAANQEFIDAGS